MNGQTNIFDADQGRPRTAAGIDAGAGSRSPRLRCWCAGRIPAWLATIAPWHSPVHGTTRPRSAGYESRINTAAPKMVGFPLAPTEKRGRRAGPRASLAVN